jgi:AcrR family transcriptional regulator
MRRMAFSPTAGPVAEGLGWQIRAIDRTVADTRSRDVERMERCIAAARELANETSSAAFTVAQIAARADVSLKAFYRCFPGKDELLLALLEDDSRLGAQILERRVAAETDARERLHAYVVGVFELLTDPAALGYAGVLVREHRRLSEEHPDELDAALASIVGVLVDEIRAAAAAGAIAANDPARDAHLTFALVLTGIHDVTLGRVAPLDAATHVWQFVWRGLGGRADTKEES